MGNSWRAIKGFVLVLAGSLVAISGRADPVAVRQTAREHFEQGIRLGQEGALDRAIVEFETAYALAPRYAVLYNLGRAYGAVGRPVEAADALRRYLEQGRGAISDERVRQVEELVAQNEARIGRLELVAAVQTAELFIDGKKVRPDKGPTELAAGAHIVSAFAPGYTSFLTTVEVRGAETTRVDIQLAREPAMPPPRSGQLVIDCSLPDVIVLVDGVHLATTPSDRALVIRAGTHAVAFERRGYVGSSRKVVVEPDGMTRQSCEPMHVGAIPERSQGTVKIVPNVPEARFAVDGRISQARVRLPEGRHAIRVRSLGYEDFFAVVQVDAGKETVLAARPVPRPDYVAEQAARARTHRTWAYIVGATGAALLVTAAVVYAVNSSNYDDWNRDRAALARDVQSMSGSNVSARLSDVMARATSIQRADDIAVASAVTGGVLVGVSAALFLTSPHPVTGARSPAAVLTYGEVW